MATQNCWKGLSPPTAEEDVVIKWYGCIYVKERAESVYWKNHTKISK